MRKNYDNQTLCNEIYRAVAAGAAPMTRLEICRAIGRNKSPHIINMIEHLTTTGYFKREVVTDAQWKTGYAYSIAKEGIEQACQSAS